MPNYAIKAVAASSLNAKLVFIVGCIPVLFIRIATNCNTKTAHNSK